MVELNRWYQRTTEDPVVGAHAFAAAGVLTAARWNPRSQPSENVLARALSRASAGGHVVPWAYPKAFAVNPSRNITDRQLADTWKDAVRHSREVTTPARLAVDASSLSKARGRQIALGVLTETGEELTGPWLRKGLDEFAISAISFAAKGEPRSHDWGWPLRVGMGRTGSRLANKIRSVPAASEWEFLRVEPRAQAGDVVILSGSEFLKFEEPSDQQVGMALVFRPLSDPIGGGDAMVRRAIAGGLATPFALIEIDGQQIPDLTNAFTFAVSHNKPLDEAVFTAYRQTAKPGVVTPPILIAPGPHIDEALGAVRIENRMRELADQIDQLPADIDLGKPPESTKSLGLKRGSRTAAEYRADLEPALNAGDVDQEMAAAIRELSGVLSAAPEAPAPQPARPGERQGGPQTEEEASRPAAEVAPSFYFALEGGQARCDEVAWGRPFDLVFNYAVPPPELLATIKGSPLQPLLETNTTLRIDIVARGGLTVSDNVVGREVSFEGGEMVGDPPRFHLRAPTKISASKTEKPGVDVTFSIDRESIYKFPLDIRLVDRLSEGPCPKITVDLDLVRDRQPRRAIVFINLEGGPWRIHWNIEGDEPASLARLTTVVNSDGLDKAYQKNILGDLKDIAEKEIWNSVTDKLELPPDAEVAAEDCMQKAMAAGWKLYDHLQSDTVFQELLEAIERLPCGSKISIHSNRTVFPWELMYPLFYDKGSQKENYKPERFWGARFQFETLLTGQSNSDGKLPTRHQQPGKLRISMGMNSSIDEDWKDHETRPVCLQKAYCDTKLEGLGKYFERYEEIIELFHKSDPSSLIYFFCHGSESELVFGEENETIEASSVRVDRYFPGWPIVFLNACEAGDIAPLSFYSFRTKFRSKRAFGIVAPSFPIPTMFAARYANMFFDRYLMREPVGEIVYNMRQELLEKKNPLGLWYSLQCPLDVKAPVL